MPAASFDRLVGDGDNLAIHSSEKAISYKRTERFASDRRHLCGQLIAMQALCGQDTAPRARPRMRQAAGLAETRVRYLGRLERETRQAQAPRLCLRVNLKTAKTLGLSIPESFLLLADEVIE